MRKIEHNVAGIIGRSREGKRSFVPLGCRFGKVESTAAGEAELKGSERLVAAIFKLIDAFYSDDGLWSWNELHSDLLLDNSVARAKRRRATVSTIGKAGQ